jgi:hypothetical protein
MTWRRLSGYPRPIVDIADEPAYRSPKHSQASSTNLGGAQVTFINPSIDSPCAHSQQLGRFLNPQ